MEYKFFIVLPTQLFEVKYFPSYVKNCIILFFPPLPKTQTLSESVISFFSWTVQKITSYYFILESVSYEVTRLITASSFSLVVPKIKSE